MALITTPAGADSDSYVTLEEANAILINNAAWQAITDEQREAYLRQATLDIDGFRFFEELYTSTQALKFPRTSDYDANHSPIIPRQVKYATCEQAAYILAGEGSKRAQLQAEGVTGFSLGDLSETYGGANTANSTGVSISVAAKGYLKGRISRIGAFS